jgi:hypothetical protein
MAGTKVKCGNCGQRILVPTPPPQTKAGTNKTTLGKIVSDDLTTTVPVATAPPPVVPMAIPAPDSSDKEVEDEPQKKRKRRKSSRFDDEDEFDDDPDDEIRIRCPFCRKKGEPYVREQISMAGWIVFAVVLFFFFPLCWIGLLMKEKARYCRRCHSRLDPGGIRF